MMLSTTTSAAAAALSATNHQPRQRQQVPHAMNDEVAVASAASAAAAAANVLAALALQQPPSSSSQQQQPPSQSQRQPVPLKKKTSLFFQGFTLKSLLQQHHSNNNINSNAPSTKSTKSGVGMLRLTTSQRKSSSSSGKRRSAGVATLRHHSSLMTVEDAASLAPSSATTLLLLDGGSTVVVDNAPPLNVMHWLETTCPADLLPSILAYCGPQKTALLGRTNRHWQTLVFGQDKEATWRVLCQDLYKWKEGDEEPVSWMEHYRFNPCVPVDYSSVQAALQLAAPPSSSLSSRHKNSPTQLKQVKSLKIWMRPGRYHLHQAIQVQAPPGVELVIETMQLPANIFQKQPYHNNNIVYPMEEQAMEQPRVLAPPRRSSSNSFLQLLRCGARSNPAAAAFEAAEATERSESSNHGGGGAAVDVLDIFGRDPDYHHYHSSRSPQIAARPQPQTHATLILQARRHNEPALCVRQGKVTLTNIAIQHFAHGLDIWNGNAAIQVQPHMNNDNMPLRLEPRPTAVLQGCKVTSSSGRGIVNIDGGHVTIRQCAIYNCAATGVYIGGPGSQATLQDSDIVGNGVGNHNPPASTTTTNGGDRRTRGGAGRGIARGHSGVYLEQGSASISNCNISENTLTGISAVSPDNAILNLTDTSLVGNGTFQLELPSVGSNARDQSRLDNNQLSTQGSGRVRSGLLPASSLATTTTTTNEPATATMR